MFDEKIPNSVNPPSNLPTEPEDIFASVEKNKPSAGGVVGQEQPFNQPAINDALSSGKLVKKEPTVRTMPDDLGNDAQELNKINDYKVSGPILGKVIMALVAVVIVVAVVLGGWWAYAKFFSKDSATTTKTAPAVQVVPAKPATIVTETETTVVVTPTSGVKNSMDTVNTSTQIKSQIDNDSILFGEGVDTDKDGLDDIREAQLKTNPNKADTDGDELNDGDEVLYWKTDPLKADTDGDTYLDGQEIKFGYNPLGPGKLTDMLKTGQATTTATTTNK